MYVCPAENVGLFELNDSGNVLTLPAVALTIPHAVMSVEQIVKLAEPLVTEVLNVSVFPLIELWITEALELLITE